jgi:Flp pilus assembly protein TadD
LKAQPKSAWARHCAAWLASGCRREPALALEFAQGAVAAEPAVENYREGLAEAQFRRGDRAAALAAMRPLAARDPRNWHFARQLARYERGAFDSPLPDAGD